MISKSTQTTRASTKSVQTQSHDLWVYKAFSDIKLTQNLLFAQIFDIRPLLSFFSIYKSFIVHLAVKVLR